MRIFLIILLWLSVLRTAAQDINAVLNSPLPLQQKTDSLLTLANSQKAMGKLDVMEHYLEAAQPLLASLNDPQTYLRYYAYKFAMYTLQRKDKLVAAEAKYYLPYIDKVNNPEFKRSCLFFTAKSYWHLRQYDSANYYFNLTEKLHNSYNPYFNWYVYAEKALMYQDVDDRRLAKEYFEKAYALTKEKGIRMDHGIMLNNLLTFYSYYRIADKYAETLKEQNEFISKRKNPAMGPSIHDIMYGNLQHMKTEERVSFLLDVRKTLKEHGDISNYTYTNIEIASAWEDSGLPEKALPYMQENMQQSLQTGYYINHFIAAKNVYRLLTKVGRHDEAGQIFEYLFKLKDSLNLNEQQVKLQELETKYQTEKKQQEIILLNSKNELSQKQIELLKTRTLTDSIQLLRGIEQRKALFRENLLNETAILEQQKNVRLLSQQNVLMNSIVKKEHAYSLAADGEKQKQQALTAALDRENNLKAEQLTKERNIKWMLIAGSSLLLVAGISILTLYRRQRKKNIIIQKQSTDLEVLMKEIHHRVKNNLQVVSSLLDLQSHYLTDAQASEAVREGKNRVQSMALIHQNLYSEGNIKGIRVKEYIGNLLQTLCDSYNITNDRVKIKSSIDDLNLDVDTMIPLGLVINELVSNAFKYAFKNKEGGELEIILRENKDKLQLVIKDNGTGFPNGLDVKNTRSFGLKMIRAFAQKLKAKLDIYNNNGAVVEMEIAKFKTA